MINKPSKEHYNPFYETYIGKFSDEDDIIQYLEQQKTDFTQLISTDFKGKEDHVYAAGKWTVKQLVGHCIDTERIMAYRALCISRGDSGSLPGFDENTYVEHANFKERSIEDLLTEFQLLRDSNLSLFRNLPVASFENVGNANGSPTSAAAVLYIIAGHLNHHMGILKDRYL